MDELKCKKNVWKPGGFSGHREQCQRKAWKDGYCKQHHPEEVKKKDQARSERWDKERADKELRQEIRDLELVIKMTKQHGFDEVADYFAKLLVEKGGI